MTLTHPANTPELRRGSGVGPRPISPSSLRFISGGPSRAQDDRMKIYVGNLPFSTTDEELRGMFAAHGAVSSAQVVIDRETGRSRGFGFVEMASDDEARKAIEAMNGQK